MSELLWIEPAGGPDAWKRFNRYTDGRPVKYINNHVDLLSSDDYMALPDRTALLLHRLWLAFALTRGHLPVGVESMRSRFRFVNRVTGMFVTSRQLALLVEGDFIQLSVTRPSRERYGFVTGSSLPRARAEVEVEVKPPNPLSVNSNNKSKPTCHICGVQHTTEAKLADHLRNVHDLELEPEPVTAHADHDIPF